MSLAVALVYTNKCSVVQCSVSTVLRSVLCAVSTVLCSVLYAVSTVLRSVLCAELSEQCQQ